MATLASLFNSKSQSIYSKFSNPNIPVEIKPDTAASRSRIKDDSRLLPVVSVQRDTSRISKFLKSNDGVLFIGKQLLLQTGNTFAETRLYNPLEALINVVPAPLGQHFPRHLGKPNPEIKNPTRTDRGALQKETINSFAIPAGNIFARIGRQVLNAITSPVQGLLTKQEYTKYFGGVGEFYIRPEDKLYRINSTDITKGWLLPPNQSGRVQALSNRGKKQIYYGSYSDAAKKLRYNTDVLPYINYSKNADALLGKLVKTNSFYKGNERSSILNIEIRQKSSTEDITKIPVSSSAFNPKYVIDTVTLESQIKKFTRTVTSPTEIAFRNSESIYQTKYFGGTQQALAQTQQDTLTIKNVITKTTGIKDPYNTSGPFTVDTNQRTELNNGHLLYTPLEGEKDSTSDIIKFVFKDTTTNAAPIHFRALISTIKQNVKPEFNEQRYVGRTERFVTYGGAKRSVSLAFNIVAFSQSELDAMWLRVNYLTGLAFPKSASPSGFMVPPLFKITVGGIYDDQPCYIENLDFDFLDETITFDIDKQVSQVINVTMTLTLLEKRSRYYNSPFYEVVQKVQESQKLISDTNR